MPLFGATPSHEQTVCFDDRAVLIDGLHHVFDGSVPFEHPLLLGVLRAKAFDLLEMLLQVKLLFVVAVSWV